MTPSIPGNAVAVVPGYWPKAGRFVTEAAKSEAVPERVNPVVVPLPFEKDIAMVVTSVSLAEGLRQTVPPVATAWACIRFSLTRPQVAGSACTDEERNGVRMSKKNAVARKTANGLFISC